MLLKNRDSSKPGRERAAREAANYQQGLLRLPVELRMEIYRHLFPADKKHTKIQGHLWLKCGFIPILHVCRRIRADVIPVFFGKTIATVHLRELNRKKSMFKHEGFYDILDDRSVAYLRWIKIKYHSECSDNGPSGFGNVVILIDRLTERVHVDSQSSFTSRGSSHEGCRGSWMAYIDRLIEKIKTMKLNTRDHHLSKQDFEELSKLKESRPCQLKTGIWMVRH